MSNSSAVRFRTRLRPRLLAVLLLLVAGGAGCFANSGASGGSRSGPITQQDVEGTTARNAYDLVQAIRPQWLRGRGAMSIQNPRPVPPVVYIEGIREPSTESLRRLDVSSILLMEYLSAADATTRFGTGHTGGAILVTLRR
jgi:hypothetical protein